MAPLSRGHIVFGDIEGKLDVLHVECTKCGRGRHYGVARLIEKHGRNGNMSKWLDTPRRSNWSNCIRSLTWWDRARHNIEFAAGSQGLSFATARRPSRSAPGSNPEGSERAPEGGPPRIDEFTPL
jgi:hypothetical protein